MLIAKTPLRISFFGGGSDLPAFLEKMDGAALSATIDKFVYVILNKTQRPLRFIHEDVTFGLANMRNQIVRETMLEYGIIGGLDIVSMSDVNAIGAGLGGSSAFAVGLINAIHRYLHSSSLHKISMNSELLAQKACEIEIDRCGYPVGIQDQYAAAYGGFRLYRYFNKPERGADTILNIRLDRMRNLEKRLILIYSGISRNGNAGIILQKQQEEIQKNKDKFELVKRVRDRAYDASKLLFEDDNKLDQFGELLHENWMEKKTLSDTLSTPEFDAMYDLAMKNGAIGGKLLGAGGGGFFLFYVPREALVIPVVQSLQKEYPNSKHYPFSFYEGGSEVTKV